MVSGRAGSEDVNWEREDIEVDFDSVSVMIVRSVWIESNRIEFISLGCSRGQNKSRLVYDPSIPAESYK